ncbi:hypothetical protein [Shouchella clausii]|uniref:hypothetical protein n=1 Tax=Shouchella clausii TaxID=79880 RepID=UPI00280BF7EC|nr:hypothetical protein [Shouchella clausii]WMM30703.1 hypothetical protein Q7C08_09935 [Shouchella clausii]
MFGLSDFLQLLMSVLIILPLATIIRESGYYLVAILLGATKKKLVIGNGPKLFSLSTIEVRRYFFMYSWMEYDELKTNRRFWHGFMYASPILTCMIVGFSINAFIAAEVLPNNMFFQTFLFYIFYFVFFDVIPVYLPDGQPTNGRAIFDLLYYGERSDYLKERGQTNRQQSNRKGSKEGKGTG